MPIFVVHKHHTIRKHYDFRLEMNGVLKSWAVPKGPPTKAGIKRLAMLVDDHPLAYAKFEGTIPEGNYGAGKVEIWDKGTYEIELEEKNDIKFTLHGEKLKGSFAIFHPPMFKKDQWLFIKHKIKK